MKKIDPNDARLVENLNDLSSSPGVQCQTKSGLEYHIAPGPGRDEHTLWEKTKSGYLELAVSDSPNELYELIGWSL